MSLADAGNTSNQGNKKNYAPTLNSRLKFKESGDSKKELSFKMNNGLLQIIIQRWDDSASKYEELQHVYLSQMKASLLGLELEKYLSTEQEANGTSYGVMTGFGEERGIIFLHTIPVEDEIVTTELVIGIVDANGNLKSDVSFRFNTQYHYALEFEKSDVKSFVPIYYDDIEVSVFKDCIVDFARNVSGAAAYGAIDSARVLANPIYNLVGQCAEKLGIERRSGSYNRAGESFFDKNKGGAANSQRANSGRSNSATLDDIEGMLDD